MATRIQVMLSCDVCGNAKNVQARTFALDGKAYEIDLCPKGGKGLNRVAAGYVSKARKVSARHSPRHNGRRPRRRAETAAIGDGGRALAMKMSGRDRVTGSTQEEAKTGSSERQAAKDSGAKAKAARSKNEAKASRSGPQKAEAASKRAAKATGVGQEKGIYVYGILPADIEVAAETPGVGEHPPRRVPCQGPLRRRGGPRRGLGGEQAGSAAAGPDPRQGSRPCHDGVRRDCQPSGQG